MKDAHQRGDRRRAVHQLWKVNGPWAVDAPPPRTDAGCPPVNSPGGIPASLLPEVCLRNPSLRVSAYQSD